MKTTRHAWLASYPKSGNTWLRLMLDSLQRNGAEPDINALELRTPILSHADLQRYSGVASSELTPEEMDNLRPQLYRAIALRAKDDLLLNKVHDYCRSTPAGERIFPPEISLGAVYIVRDPRDVAVSAAHFFGVDIGTMVGNLAREKLTLTPGKKTIYEQLPQHLGGWSSHVLSWLDHSAMPVLLVHYKDMHADPVGQLIRVAEFLGLPTEHAAAAVEATRFDRLRRQEDEGHFKERPRTAEKFFRQGKTGEGKLVLTAPQRARIESDHGAVMARLGFL